MAHLLLGLCRAGPNVATQALRGLGISPASVCQQIVTGLRRDFWFWFAQRPNVW